MKKNNLGAWVNMKREGSLVECLTRDRGVAGLGLIGGAP